MSIPVALDEIESAAADYGPTAFVLVSSHDGPPRVTHSLVRFESGTVVVTVGPRTAAALAVNPTASILWPATASQSMSLIVDGIAAEPFPEDGGEVAIVPSGAVRHRPASG